MYNNVMQFKELTDNNIAIQFEGTTEDGTAADESLVGQPTEEGTNNDNIELTLEKYKKKKKQKNDSIFL